MSHDCFDRRSSLEACDAFEKMPRCFQILHQNLVSLLTPIEVRVILLFRWGYGAFPQLMTEGMFSSIDLKYALRTLQEKGLIHTYDSYLFALTPAGSTTKIRYEHRKRIGVI